MNLNFLNNVDVLDKFSYIVFLFGVIALIGLIIAGGLFIDEYSVDEEISRKKTKTLLRYAKICFRIFIVCLVVFICLL